MDMQSPKSSGGKNTFKNIIDNIVNRQTHHKPKNSLSIFEKQILQINSHQNEQKYSVQVASPKRCQRDENQLNSKGINGDYVQQYQQVRNSGKNFKTRNTFSTNSLSQSTTGFGQSQKPTSPKLALISNENFILQFDVNNQPQPKIKTSLQKTNSRENLQQRPLKSRQKSNSRVSEQFDKGGNLDYRSRSGNRFFAKKIPLTHSKPFVAKKSEKNLTTFVLFKFQKS